MIDAGKLDNLLTALNDEQRQAVLHEHGPALVLAGAGSGKTRVLISRIAHLLASGQAEPHAIMAVTFTNKAAREMHERLAQIANWDFRNTWIGTFHSLNARILRREAHHAGLKRSFNIYDADDQLNAVKLVMNDLKLSTDVVQPKHAAYQISLAKNASLSPAEFRTLIEKPIDNHIADIYARYEQLLRENNAVDFDDLLMIPLILFRNFPEVLRHYQSKFRFILVDEFQDTNRAQYAALQHLSSQHRNLFVVGDDDQSIYRWRGADLRNILEFGKDYPDHKVFRLERNYRSSKNILAAAHSVIINNQGRHSKQLWTENDAGAKIRVLEASNEFEEAELIVQKIDGEFADKRRNFRDFAILYRTNSQSRALEDGLRRHSIPYVIVGGLRFYERKEVKDLLAYFRVVSNPADVLSIRRIINYPLRGIGEATLQKLGEFALTKRLSFFDTLAHAEEVPGIGPNLAATIKAFHAFISKYISLKDKISVTELTNSLVEETGILQNYKEEGTPDALARLENIRELLNAVSEYAYAQPDATLDGFLEQVSLVSDIDNWEDKNNAVTLMTLHSAKGLEFPVVFLSGMEQGLFPLARSLENRDDLEEERRLFYVGATRAKEKLYISWASSRRKFGELTSSMPSRFLKELDQSLIDYEAPRPGSRQPAYRSGAARSPYRRRPADSYQQEMPAYEDFSQEEIELHVGSRVRHSHFGDGCVIRMEGRGQNLRVIVDFESEGEKTIMVQYANLQIL